MPKAKKPKKQTKWVRQQAILSALKKVFVKSPMYAAVRDSVKAEYTAKNKDGTDSKARRVHYLCKGCNGYHTLKNIYSTELNKNGTKKKRPVKSLEMDHVEPVINPETGFIGISDWIEREFVGIEIWDPKVNTAKDLENKLQFLCRECHNKKSVGENSERRKVKKERKNGK